MFDVIAYGAVADDKTDSTDGFQAAIDACAAAGGGVVNVPAGKYAIDMTSLRSNVELHLEAGAEIRSLVRPVPRPDLIAEEPSANSRRWLIGGEKISNAAITGEGIIDGRGYEVFWPKDDGYEHPLYGQRYWPQLHRPKGMVCFRECRSIRIEGVTLMDPPCYTVWCLGCDFVEIRNLKIRADLKGPNCDGLDIDCSSHVNISNCDIVCGDDCIAIKSDTNDLGYDKACEYVHAENCRFSCTSCGIRLGYEGDGAIRNCSFKNITMDKVMIGISIMVAISPADQRGTLIKYGPKITDCTFEDLDIRAIQGFNFQYVRNPEDCPDPILGFADDITFRNLKVIADRGSYLGGAPDAKIRKLYFENVAMVLSGNMGTDFSEKVPYPYPVWNDLAFTGLPWAYYARHAENLFFKRCSVTFDQAFGHWEKEPVRTEDVTSCEAEFDCLRI